MYCALLSYASVSTQGYGCGSTINGGRMQFFAYKPVGSAQYAFAKSPILPLTHCLVITPPVKTNTQMHNKEIPEYKCTNWLIQLNGDKKSTSSTVPKRLVSFQRKAQAFSKHPFICEIITADFSKADFLRNPHSGKQEKTQSQVETGAIVSSVTAHMVQPAGDTKLSWDSAARICFSDFTCNVSETIHLLSNEEKTGI